MSRVATPISLSEEQREVLESWVRQGTMEQRMVQRARIVLESAAGKPTKEIARGLGLRNGTVSQWRTRFSRSGPKGLTDTPRTGKPAKYDGNTERRILAQLVRQHRSSVCSEGGGHRGPLFGTTGKRLGLERG